MYLHVAIYLGFQHSTAGGKDLDPRMLPIKRIGYYCYQLCVNALDRAPNEKIKGALISNLFY